MELYFENEFMKGVSYDITISSSIKNCIGISMLKDTIITFGIPQNPEKYDIIIIDKIGLISKQLFYIIPIILLFLLFYVITPEVILNNFLNTFDFNSMANAGRIYAYGQSLLLFISYTPIEKLFGSPGNEVFDIYDRLIASESGVISMFLDIK